MIIPKKVYGFLNFFLLSKKNYKITNRRSLHVSGVRKQYKNSITIDHRLVILVTGFLILAGFTVLVVKIMIKFCIGLCNSCFMYLPHVGFIYKGYYYPTLDTRYNIYALLRLPLSLLCFLPTQQHKKKGERGKNKATFQFVQSPNENAAASNETLSFFFSENFPKPNCCGV